jgi:predicted DNA-binding transcriptional regulator YafY
MVLIHQALQGRGRVTAPTLAASMEIATKTVYRDLDFMRDRLRLPIAWDFKERSYRIQIGKDQP